MEVSVGSSDFFIGFALSCVDTSNNSCNSGNSVLGLLDLGDGDVGGMDGDLIGSSVGFVFGEFVDVDSPFLSEDLDDFSLGAFTSASKDDDLIILADGKRSDTIFFAEVLGES